MGKLIDGWKSRSPRIKELLQNVEFDLAVKSRSDRTVFDNYSDEKQRWLRVMIKPILQKYRQALAKGSRDETREKLEKVNHRPIKSFVQLMLWNTKIKDAIKDGKSIGQQSKARRNINIV